MSCGDRTLPVNPERPGEPGRWVRNRRPASQSTTCVHRWRYRNALGVIGGPGVQECLRCGESHWPTWVPDAAVRLALPPAAPAVAGSATHRPWPYIVGEAQWADLLRDRGAA